jgi:hypothetical protein
MRKLITQKTSKTVCVSICSALLAAPAAFAITFTETFDSASSTASHGWATFNAGVNGNSVGWTNSSLSGGVAGEAKGDFRRSAQRVYYGTDMVDALISSQELEAFGKLNVTAVVGNGDHAFGAWISFFTTSNGGQVGLLFNNSPSGFDSAWGLGIRDDSGFIALAGLDSSRVIGLGVARTFSFSWDPLANGGNGTLSGEVTGAGSPLTINLTSAQRASFDALRFDRFGLNMPGFNTTGTGSDLRIDDVTFTIPEPSSAALLALGGGLFLWRRWATRNG